MKSRDSKVIQAAKRNKQIQEKRRLLAIENAKLQAQIQRDIETRVIKTETARSEAVEKRLREIEEVQQSFIQELDLFLSRESEKDDLKKRELHNHWTEHCYQRIQNQIAAQVDKIDMPELKARLAKVLEDYVQVVSVKSVFLDTVIESEYNPFELKENIIKVDAAPRSKTKLDGIVDCLTEQIQKVLERHEGKTHLLPHGGRATDFPVKKWHQVEATPAGYAAKWFDESLRPPDPKANQRGRVLRQKSNMISKAMDHYNIPMGAEGAALAMAETAINPKRTFPDKNGLGSEVTTSTREYMRGLNGLGSLRKDNLMKTSKPPYACDADPMHQKEPDPYSV